MNPTAPARRRPGFTLIEVLTTLMVASVVVRIGAPGYQGAVREGEAAQVASDFQAVRQAVADYRAQHGQWPAESGPGIVPPELSHYLSGLPFNRGHYRLDWQNWALPAGLPGVPGARAVLALSVITEDRALGAALLEILGPRGNHFVLGDSYTFILDVD